MRLHTIVVAIITFTAACAPAAPPKSALPPVTKEDGDRVAQEMAADGSRLDVPALVKFIPQTDRIVYVSDTNPISGKGYAKDIGDFYKTLSKLDYHRDSLQSLPISDNAVIVTGWASITTVPLKGKTESVRAIVTSVYVRDSTGWKRVISHKTTIPPPKVGGK
jgi:hypothetical protein